VRVGFVAGPPVFCFAQRAFCARLSFRRVAAGIVDLTFTTAFWSHSIHVDLNQRGNGSRSMAPLIMVQLTMVQLMLKSSTFFF
jgi:hypothetical protein